MPALGMAQESGVLVRWLVAEGDTVAEGDPLMEVETDKAVVEVPATSSGTLAAVAYREGAEVAVGTVLAVLLAPGEATGAAAGAASAAAGAARAAAPSPGPAAASGASSGAASGAAPPQARFAPAAAGATAIGAIAGSPPPARTTASGAYKAVLASPKAKRLAREFGLDLAAVIGSGPGGAVRAVDLPLAGAAPASSNVPTPTDLAGAARRGAVAAAGTVPAAPTDAAWLRTDLDTAGLSEFLARVSRALADKAVASTFFRGAHGGAVTVGVADVLTRAVAAGLSRDASFGGQELRLRLSVNGPARTSAVLTGGQAASILDVARARAARADAAAYGPLPVEVVDNSGEDFERSPSPLDAATAVRLTLGPIKEAVAVHGGAPSVRQLATLSLEYRTSPSDALDDDRAAELFTYVSRILADPFFLAVSG